MPFGCVLTYPNGMTDREVKESKKNLYRILTIEAIEIIYN